MTSARSVPLVRLIVTQPALMFCIRTGGDRRRDNHRGYKRSYQDSLPGTLPDGHGGHLEDGRARYAWGGRHDCCFRKVGGFVYWCAQIVSGDISVILYEGESPCLPSVVQPFREKSSCSARLTLCRRLSHSPRRHFIALGVFVLRRVSAVGRVRVSWAFHTSHVLITAKRRDNVLVI